MKISLEHAQQVAKTKTHIGWNGSLRAVILT